MDPHPRLVLDQALDPVDGMVLGDGRVVVLDRLLPGLLLYDSSGTLLKRFGGAGKGPGEFLRPDEVFPYRGDSLGTFDSGSTRVNIFSSDGNYSRSVMVRTGLSRVAFVGVLADGSLVFRGSSFEAHGRVWREPAEVFRIPAGGGASEPIATVPGWEFYRGVVQGRPVVGVTPFGPRTLVTAIDSILTVHIQEDCSLSVLALDGHASAILRSPCESRRLTESDIQQYRSERVARMKTEPEKERAERVLGSSQVPYPERVPAFDRLMHDSAKNLWAEVYPLFDDEVRRWWVFREDGRWRGEVSVPPNLELRWAGNESVLGLAMDEVGRKVVQVHLVRRAKS